MARRLLPPLPPDGLGPDPYKLLLSTRASYANTIRDYTAIFTKQERINGALRPREKTFMKFQEPHKVYMKWVSGAKEGQEVIYVDGKNGNKILAHPGFGGFIGGLLNVIIPTFALTPDGPTAMKDNRHPITRAGIGKMIETLILYTDLARANNDLTIVFRGEDQVEGRPALVVERILPEKDGYPAHRARMYIDREYNLPVQLVLLDWDNRLLGFYQYSSLVLNPGLKPSDFETRNKEYRFGLGLVPPIIRD